jgi:hypothetical protein
VDRYALFRFGKSVVPQLREILKTTDVSAEKKTIEEFLERFDNSKLTLTISADKAQVDIGGTVVFTVTIENKTDDDINVDLGHLHHGNSFKTGLGYSVLAENDRFIRGAVIPDLKMNYTRNVFGHHRIAKTVKAHDRVSFEGRAVVRTEQLIFRDDKKEKTVPALAFEAYAFEIPRQLLKDGKLESPRILEAEPESRDSKIPRKTIFRIQANLGSWHEPYPGMDVNENDPKPENPNAPGWKHNISSDYIELTILNAD